MTLAQPVHSLDPHLFRVSDGEAQGIIGGSESEFGVEEEEEEEPMTWVQRVRVAGW